MSDSTGLRVLILAFDGVEALDFAGPYEVFTTASRVSQRMRPGSAAPFEVASVALAAAGQPVHPHLLNSVTNYHFVSLRIVLIDTK
ncbi:hypothetical protein [Nostoc sp. PA-18-2419]|uniref:hypothetical protein n=1 Tax=Nostoc sp. PA-18-2419 TaxID=2575443 RepID=UPI001CB942AE|nr:hypothetical protein [Nostoc sp. PA-18-2419]